MKKPKLGLIRTVKTWVCYKPLSRELRKGYTTKKEAVKAQKKGEVIFQMKGYYASKSIKR